MSKVTPVLHRIFVKPDKVEEVDETIKRAREAGIHIELDKREQKACVVGTVVSIGSTAFVGFDTLPEQQGVVVGAKVLYAKYAGADVPTTDLIVLNDEDILGVLENE